MTRAPARRLLTVAVAVLVPAALLVATVPVVLAGPAAAGTVAGSVLNFGTAGAHGSLQGTTLAAPVVGMATTSDGGGYWLAASDGGVFAFGDALYFGSMGGTPLDAPVVGVAATPDGGGYWLVASDGGVFAFGDAIFYGSMGGKPLHAPVVGIAAAPDGHGYWLVAADGGVFAFGSAGYAGSMGGTLLDAPVVGMAAVPGGGGYWLVARDGGVFAFGSAGYAGSMGGRSLDAPVVGMAAPSSGGYWLVASDGGVFSFGGAPFEGSAAGTALVQPVIAMAGAHGGQGYWMVEGAPLAGKVVTVDPGHNGGNAGDPAAIDAPVFNGRTEEACDTTGTATDGGYSEAQFNFNVALDLAADLRAQGATVVLTRDSNTGVGPCVTQRAAIGNDAHSDAAVAIHADGGPPQGRGFAILEPVADGPNDDVIASSAVLGTDLRNSFLAGTGEPVSSYDGVDGIQPRDDLGGINLTTVPKVFIECANMRNATDAALVVNPAWQSQAAAAIDDGITEFLLSQ